MVGRGGIRGEGREEKHNSVINNNLIMHISPQCRIEFHPVLTTIKTVFDSGLFAGLTMTPRVRLSHYTGTEVHPIYIKKISERAQT